LSDTAIPFPRHIPFVEALGFELLSFGEGKALLRLQVQPEQENSHGMAHGGVQMTLLDVAMAHAARSGYGGPEGDDPGVVTVEMKTSFMRTARGTLTARATLLQKTQTLAFTEGGIYDEAGHLCSHATGTFKFVRPPKPKTP
jgi:uncharacterized protein (TIGR00369 family)